MHEQSSGVASSPTCSSFPILAELQEVFSDPASVPLLPCPRLQRPSTTSSRLHCVRRRPKKREALWRTACLFCDALASLDSGIMISRTQRRQTRASHSSNSTSLTAAQQRLHQVCLREAQRLELVRREETRSGSFFDRRPVHFYFLEN